jgi:omega-amidase
MENLKISIIQSDIYWENISANLAHLEELFSTTIVDTDLIILPEMFATGFTMNVNSMGETMNGQIHKWLKIISKRYNAAICGSFICKEKNAFFNRFIFVEPNETYYTYDKKHLFRLGKETEHFSPGNLKTVIEYRNWKIMPLICYDLRFPNWSKNSKLAYDLLIYVASWPSKRTYAWDTLLKARALENQAYVVGTNRIGDDGNNLQYDGHSISLNYEGKPLNEYSKKEAVINIELSKPELNSFRESFPFHLDID